MTLKIKINIKQNFENLMCRLLEQKSNNANSLNLYPGANGYLKKCINPIPPTP